MHIINTFLFGQDGEYSQAAIFDLIKSHFSGDESAEFSEEEQPFGLSPKLRIEFSDYWILISVIQDESIKESINNIQEITKQELETTLSPQCEVRTFFAPDENSEFDHIAIDMYQFLEGLPNSLVYDDNHEKIISKCI
ncbi:hypothetical protein [Pseudoalteromonas sp. TB64]|uniref:hypothetical protein n=1 Tax=Pseudoalteromonas sp. TB64 TaxID=1938600 RepID=UPI0004633EC6|nr:hypothetical protein [Pseudoalteromonas sp. TB64]